MSRILTIITLNLFFSSVSGQVNDSTKMSDFIGLNSNVASYDQKYLSDLAKCAKWMREYHSWEHYEVADNYYKWDNITTYPQGYTWPDHNKFMDQCRQLGINVLIDVLNKPDWAGTARGANSSGDGSQSVDYLDKLEFMGQLVARYGAQKIDKAKLETADKVSGLNYIKYYEDDNEPDYWWENPLWPAEKYAVWCNAVHDGYGVESSEDYPLLGIKSVDSTAFHVLGGLAKNNITYIQKILEASNGRVPFDVINIHTYCTDDKKGYSPENENYGLEKNLTPFLSWCEKTLPGMPVWLTEFGWDTYGTSTSGSYIFAPPQQQANYLVRSYFIALKMGFGKAFMFMDKDPNSTSTLQYNSSGLLTDQGAGLAKKPSFYYLATVQNLIGDAFLKKIHSYRKPAGSNEIFCFEFVKDNNESVYALWTRTQNSQTDNGTSISYNLELDYQPDYARLVELKDKDIDGTSTDIPVTEKSVALTISEKPLFLIVSGNSTSNNLQPDKSFEFNVFPNPVTRESNIKFVNPKSQHIRISAFSSTGEFVEKIADDLYQSGHYNLLFGKDLKPGMYIVFAELDGKSIARKVVVH